MAGLLISLAILYARLPSDFMASLLFGLRGGLACAFLISVNFFGQMPAEGSGQQAPFMAWGLEVALYFATGLITGGIVDRERREARRLKEAQDLALLGQAAAAAHELKTPMIAIGGFAQRMLGDLPPDYPHQRPLSIVVDQAAHMEQLLRKMLDYSRPVELDLSAQPLVLLLEEFGHATT